MSTFGKLGPAAEGYLQNLATVLQRFLMSHFHTFIISSLHIASEVCSTT
jgi:hypothetical protein